MSKFEFNKAGDEQSPADVEAKKVKPQPILNTQQQVEAAQAKRKAEKEAELKEWAKGAEVPGKKGLWIYVEALERGFNSTDKSRVEPGDRFHIPVPPGGWKESRWLRVLKPLQYSELE